LKRHLFLGCFACVLGISSMSHAQAIPTASRIGGSIQVGVGGFLANPDFGQTNIKGLTFYADFDLGQHLGVEGVIHYSVLTPSDVSENSYLAGPRYIVRHKKFEGYAKALFGAGHFGLQEGSFANPNTSTYFEYALGGGLEYRATHHINVRVIDFEAQKWPDFATHGLSPYVGTIGVAYVFR
jgi:opacity protein-like surface antigen